MNNRVIIVVMLAFLTVSCKNGDPAENKIEANDGKAVATQGVTVSTFAVDTIVGTRFSNEIKTRLNNGDKSLSIITQYYVGDSLKGEITNGPFKNAQFQGQKIITDTQQHYQLYYLIKGSDDQLSLFQVKPALNQLEIAQIDSSLLIWKKLTTQLVDR